MGFNATVVVLLDRLREIEKDPEFGRKLADAIRYKVGNPQPGGAGYRYGADEATGQTQVIEVHHADGIVAVAVGGNTGQVLGYCGRYDASPAEMVKTLRAEVAE